MFKESQSNNFDVVVIGGGAAGIMSAISCKKSHPDYSIAIIDRTYVLGRKILVCGAGRCNVTNINLNRSAENRFYGADPEFTKAVFEQFNYEDIVSFFNDLGIELYVERKTEIGKLFPVTDQAKTINTLLEDELERLGIKIFLNTDCKEIENITNNEKYNFFIKAQLIDNNQPKGKIFDFKSKYLILSAGGKTYPALGSNGSGYLLAEKFGHKIIEGVPSAVALVGKNPFSQEANGTKLDIEVTSIIEGKEIKKTVDDVMFTQYGLSGPAILNISREISIEINRYKKNNCKVRLNFFPKKNVNEVRLFLLDRWKQKPDQKLIMSLMGLFPPKLPPLFLRLSKLNKDIKVNELKETEINKLIEIFTNYIVDITDTRGWNEAEFTAGGIDTKELKLKTLESKFIQNLYICGEILDVDGDVGGFNLSWAWSSGFVAGKLS